MIKGYKIRLYPNKEQELLLWKQIHGCRFIWNYMLDLQQKNYEQGKDFLFAYDMIKMLHSLKNDGIHNWLYEVSNASLQGVCKDLDIAFRDFFKGDKKHPRFKSKKRSDPKYPLRTDGITFYNDNKVHIAKIGKVKYKTDFDMPTGYKQKFKNPRISYIDKKWFLSLGIECEKQTSILTNKSMGIDLGIKKTIVAMCDQQKIVFNNINKSKKMKELDKKIKFIQKRISRKYEYNKQGIKYVKTKNIEKEEEKLRKLRKKQKNIRYNYIHQMTSNLISFLPYRVIMEDLNVSGMMKNKHLSKAIQEQSFFTIIKIMKYKCEWNGIEFIQADRFYPSSKTCSHCGFINSNLKLKDRIFICPECGLQIDRDENAAINLMKYMI